MTTISLINKLYAIMSDNKVIPRNETCLKNMQHN